MSQLEQLRQRAETAERQIEILQKEFDKLQTRNGTKITLNNQVAKKKDDDSKVEELPFKVIEDEIYVIRDKWTNATMTVTVCNGESNPPFISAKGINYLKNNFNSTEKDIFVDTYAKCGTTLCIHLVYQILSTVGITCSGASKEDMADPWNAVPWIEVSASQELVDKDKPFELLKYIDSTNAEKNNKRIWKSHSPYINFPVCKLHDKTRIIHCTRNPKDVVCSYFNFFQKEPFVKYTGGDFNTLFDWFCDGSVVHSNFWDFELAWWRAVKENPKQILWITFEEIVRTPHNAIKTVAAFLNQKLTDTQVDTIAEEISFDKMKITAMKKKGSIANALMNKGTIGRWQKKLTEEQSARIDRITGARFADTGIEFDFGDNEEFAKEFYAKRRIKDQVVG